jgi:hypothetical protein
MKNSIRELVREIIKEELGRDLESTTDSMLDWRHLPGVDISITAADVKKNNSISGGGRWVVNIKFEDGKVESREFGSEADANFHARQNAMAYYHSRVASGNLKSVKPFGPPGFPVEGR